MMMIMLSLKVCSNGSVFFNLYTVHPFESIFFLALHLPVRSGQVFKGVLCVTTVLRCVQYNCLTCACNPLTAWHVLSERVCALRQHRCVPCPSRTPPVTCALQSHPPDAAARLPHPTPPPSPPPPLPLQFCGLEFPATKSLLLLYRVLSVNLSHSFPSACHRLRLFP